MLSITHLVVSLLLIQVLMLDRNDAFVALVFGVFIDLDHLFGLREYAQANGIRSLFDLQNMINPGGHWKSMLHSPIAIAVISPLSIASRLMVPLLFWGVHIFMDIIEESLLGNFSTIEAMLFAVVGLALVTIRYGKYLESYASGTFSHYVRMELDGLRGVLRPSAL